MDDDALIARQALLQEEARAVAAAWRIEETLAAAGRVVLVGSAATGLMVWRDLDFVVDAPGLDAEGAWRTLEPLLVRSAAVHHEHLESEHRHYFVLQIDRWKVDVSLWYADFPAEVERFQQELPGRLTDEARVAILRLKEAWHPSPDYPERVNAWPIYEAVLQHGIRTLGGLDAFLAARGLPTLAHPCMHWPDEAAGG